MPIHWTYDDFSPDADLWQGDVLEPTEELKTLLEQVHHHFCDPKYVGFMIVTQSCDLVRQRTSRYLTIAVIRTLKSVLGTFLETTCQKFSDICFSSDDRDRAKQLLIRILNQNEQALGLFYLYPDGEAGIGEDSVALLRVTVALRSEHYEVLQRARRGRLKKEFGHKLGWLAGNLFSRVGTTDWNESDSRKAELHEKISYYLDPEKSPSAPIWIKPSVAKSIKQEGSPLTTLTREDLQRLNKERTKERPKEVALKIIVEHVKRILPQVESQRLEQLKLSLSNDQVFSSAVRQS